METNLIPSMKQTLFDSDAADILLDYAEIGLDAVLDDGILKDIPVIGTIVSFCKIGLNLRERNLIKQLETFIQSFNRGTIDPKKLDDYRKTLDDPKKAENELGRVILLLDRTLEKQRAQFLGQFYRAYVAGDIKWDMFVELSEINDLMTVIDYTFLRGVNLVEIGEIAEDAVVSANSECRYQRLISYGIITENPKKNSNEKAHRFSPSYLGKLILKYTDALLAKKT